MKYFIKFEIKYRMGTFLIISYNLHPGHLSTFPEFKSTKNQPSIPDVKLTYHVIRLPAYHFPHIVKT